MGNACLWERDVVRGWGFELCFLSAALFCITHKDPLTHTHTWWLRLMEEAPSLLGREKTLREDKAQIFISMDPLRQLEIFCRPAGCRPTDGACYVPGHIQSQKKPCLNPKHSGYADNRTRIITQKCHSSPGKYAVHIELINDNGWAWPPRSWPPHPTCDTFSYL